MGSQFRFTSIANNGQIQQESKSGNVPQSVPELFVNEPFRQHQDVPRQYLENYLP